MITEENKSALQFLDLMSTIDKYSELSGDLLKEKLQAFVKAINVDFEIVKISKSVNCQLKLKMI